MFGWLTEPLSNVIGGVLGAGAGAYSAKQQQRFEADQAQLNRSFQERMSSTAHQREVADLRKAGLNPILSVNRSGASTPAGSMAKGTQMDLANSAKTGALLSSQVKLAEAQAKKTNAEAERADVMTPVFEALGDVIEKLTGEATNSAGSLGDKTKAVTSMVQNMITGGDTSVDMREHNSANWEALQEHLRGRDRDSLVSVYDTRERRNILTQVRNVSADPNRYRIPER